MNRVIDKTENITVVHEQVTPLSLSTYTTSRCSSDLISVVEHQSETQQQQQLPDSQSFQPIPVNTLLSGLLNKEKPLLLASWSEYYSKLVSQPAVASARADSITWILKVTAFFGFQPLTAYTSISYLDRFLSARHLPSNTNGWVYQLLSVACLSLAAKVEEVMVPSLIDLQTEGADVEKIFEPKTVRRMELLVLGVLKWRLRSVTPFHFLAAFAFKLNPTGALHGYLASQASDIILTSASAAALLYVAREIQGSVCQYIDLDQFAMSWSADGLSRDSITGCCGILQECIISIRSRKSIEKFTEELHSSSPTSNESSSTSPCKRRKLNDNLWV